MAASFTGKKIQVQVQAINMMGTTTSKAQIFTLADVPGKPFPAPLVDKAETTTAQIKVTFANQNTQDGGSQITRLELFMDDGY